MLPLLLLLPLLWGALTQKPDIHFLEPLRSGFPQNLTCSLPGFCEGGRPLTFSWVGGALDRLDPQTVSSSVLTLTPRLQDHGSNLTCRVSLPGAQSTVERTIRLNVSCECWRDGWIPQGSGGRRGQFIHVVTCIKNSFLVSVCFCFYFFILFKLNELTYSVLFRGRGQ
uniref:Ig-like domain-containing protein n=1 Tax=Canis lupus dingo TaxID=286419 RepID=A0A8C0L3R2_CANLU